MRYRLANLIRLLKLYKSYYHNNSNPTLLLKIKSDITDLKIILKNTLMSNFIIGILVKDKEIADEKNSYSVCILGNALVIKNIVY